MLGNWYSGEFQRRRENRGAPRFVPLWRAVRRCASWGQNDPHFSPSPSRHHAPLSSPGRTGARGGSSPRRVRDCGGPTMPQAVSRCISYPLPAPVIAATATAARRLGKERPRRQITAPGLLYARPAYFRPPDHQRETPQRRVPQKGRGLKADYQQPQFHQPIDDRVHQQHEKRFHVKSPFRPICQPKPKSLRASEIRRPRCP